jgi:hypothetical protein
MIVPELKNVFGRKVAQMQGAEKFETPQMGVFAFKHHKRLI